MAERTSQSGNDFSSATRGPTRASRGPFALFLRLFSSIWLGVCLLLLLFVYSSVGSAGVLIPKGLALGSDDNWIQYHVRQYRGLEMTEFEWFHWWPFVLLIGLICLNLVTATLRRIPFKPVNYGVWMIHTGIIVLCAGSVYYFGTKHEGDAPVTRRRIVVEVPGNDPVSLIALPGNHADVGGYHLTVLGTNPRWELLSGDDQGKTTYKVSVQVSRGDDRFIRELLAGFPQYTEDVMASGNPQQPMARAKKVIGRALVDETLSLSLEFEPQDHFFLMNSWALYLREPGQTRWSQRPIDRLPRYNDYIGSPEEVWLGQDLPLDPLDLEVPAVEAGDPLAEVPIRLRSYLRYATMQSRRIEGGDRLEPALSLQVHPVGQARPLDLQLVAFDPQNNRDLVGGRRLRFEWADSPQAVEALRQRVRPMLLVGRAGDDPVERPVVAAGQNGPLQEIEGTAYRYRVVQNEDGLELPGGEVVSIALVEIESPGGVFVRWVFDDPQRPNRDFAPGENGLLHGNEIALDPAVRMVYRPAMADAMFVAGPGEDHLVFMSAAGGETTVEPIAEGDSRTLPGGTRLDVRRFAARTVEKTRPAVVPPSQRDRNADVFFSMVRVELPGLSEDPSIWLPFNHYVYDDPDETLWRYPSAPQRLRMADGREIEIAFGRRRRPLPAPVALDDFKVVEQVGGFTGSTLSILDWISEIRFLGEDERWTDTLAVQVNKPVEHDGYWFFQAQWDPPAPQRGSAGLNYTVLGVGNRRGVNIQLAGCCIAVIGMIYAFYVKPIIKRRRRQAVDAGLAAERGAGRRSLPAAERPVLEPVAMIEKEQAT